MNPNRPQDTIGDQPPIQPFDETLTPTATPVGSPAGTSAIADSPIGSLAGHPRTRGPAVRQHAHLEPVGEHPGTAPRQVPLNIAISGRVRSRLVAGVSLLAFAALAIGSSLDAGVERAVFQIPSLIPLVGALGLTATGLRRARTDRDLLTHGSPALATIGAIGVDREVVVNGRRARMITFTFEVDGRTFESSTSSVRKSDRSHAPGDRVWIVHDPAHPAEATLWPTV